MSLYPPLQWHYWIKCSATNSLHKLPNYYSSMKELYRQDMTFYRHSCTVKLKKKKKNILHTSSIVLFKPLSQANKIIYGKTANLYKVAFPTKLTDGARRALISEADKRPRATLVGGPEISRGKLLTQVLVTLQIAGLCGCSAWRTIEKERTVPFESCNRNKNFWYLDGKRVGVGKQPTSTGKVTLNM